MPEYIIQNDLKGEILIQNLESVNQYYKKILDFYAKIGRWQSNSSFILLTALKINYNGNITIPLSVVVINGPYSRRIRASAPCCWSSL